MASADGSIACVQVADVYERVIDDVIENMRATFREEGVDESVLVDLQNLWSEKLHQQGTVVPSAPVVHQVMIDKAAPALATLPPGAGPYQPLQQSAAATAGPAVVVAASVAPAPAAAAGGPAVTAPRVQLAAQAAALSRPVNGPPQADGPGDDPSGDAVDDDDDDDDLGSDLDDDDPLADDGCADDEGNFIICQYDKIQRTKNKDGGGNKYKVQLRSGIMQVNNTEYMFQKAEGKFTW